MDDFQLALAHYRLLFPALASLAAGAQDVTGVARWRAEYDRVASCGLSATLITNSTMEGGGVGASRNFDQKTLLAALHARRAELDSTYHSSLVLPAPILAPANGSIYRLGF